MDVNRIDLVTLQRVCNKIFNFVLEDLKITHVDLDENLYWSLPKNVRNNMGHTPHVDQVGSLADDYGFILAADKDVDQALPLLLEHVAPLLAALATKLPNFR